MKRKRRYSLTNPSYYQKLVLSHLLVLLLTVSIMAGFNILSSKSVQSERMLDLVRYSGRQTVASVVTRFSQMANVSETVRYSLQQMLGNGPTLLPRPQVAAETGNTLKSFRDAFSFYDITAYLPSSSFAATEGITFFDINLPGGRQRRPEVLGAPYNQLTWIATMDYAYPFMRFTTYDTFNILSCFIRVSTMDTPGAFCFFIDIDEREIASRLLESRSTMPITQYITDGSGKIISHRDKALLGTQIPAALQAALAATSAEETLTYDNTVYIRYPLDRTGWSLIVELPQSYLSALSLTSINGILLAVSIATLVSVLVSFLISHQLLRKLFAMNSVLHSIVPHFKINSESFEKIDIRMQLPKAGAPHDVLDDLALAFNTLLDRLNVAMQDALTNTLAHEKLRYQLLRAKINPHFLYNILDSIKICNSLGRTEDANRMISQLALFYRLILRKNDLDMITIGEELEIVKLYLEMEGISHEHSFSYTVQTDPDIVSFIIPRFVLQPLVENCVTHGLPGDAKKMTVDISLRYTQDAISITITDDGLGILAEHMAQLMAVTRGEWALPSGATGSTRFYALTNVCARLKPYVVCSDTPITFVSTPGQGTRVTIELKQILQDEVEQ